jgi:zinc protease
MKQIKMWGDDELYYRRPVANSKRTISAETGSGMREKPSDLPHNLTYWWCSTSLNYSTDYNDNMQKYTRADIQRYVKTYVVDKPYVAGLIINDDMNKQYKPSEYFTTAKSF